MKSKAIVFSGVNQTGLMEFELPEVGLDQVLIETKASCISPGTELRCLAGKEENAGAFPFIPGYATAGVVIKAGADAGVPVGARVTCNGIRNAIGLTCSWGGHTQYSVSPAAEVCLIPDNLDFATAAMAIVMAIPMRGAVVSRPTLGEEVAVIGLGLIGSFSARIFRASGAKTVAFDLSRQRVDIARAAGVDAQVITGDLLESVKKYLPDGADVVVDSTGVGALTAKTMQIARDLGWGSVLEKGPRFVFQGSVAGEVNFPYQTAFLREMSVYFPRDRRKADIQNAMALVAAGQVKVTDKDFLRAKYTDHAAIYETVRSNQLSTLTAVFEW